MTSEHAEDLENAPADEKKSVKKLLDLTSHEMFPSLMSIHHKEEVDSVGKQWGHPIETNARSGVITQVFQMPVEHQRRSRDSESSLAEICQQVGHGTRTHIDASRSGQTLAFTFVIKGQQMDIVAAQRKLWAKLAETIIITVEVPEECLGLVIGPAGRNLNTLMTETSTKVNIPKPYEGQVLISGDFEGISIARQRIEALIHGRLSRASASISIERHLMPFVFDTPTSSKVNQIVDDFAAKRNVKISTSGAKEGEIIVFSIHGDRDYVNPAVELLNMRLEEARRNIKSVPTHVSKSLHRFVIGPRGETLHALEDETGCYVYVPAPEDPSDSITVYGTDAALIKGLRAVLERTSSVDSRKILVEKRTKSLILHRHRGISRELETKFNVHVHPNEDGFIIDGNKAGVTLAAMQLNNAVQTLLTYKFEHLVVDPTYLKHIIGRKGHSLQQIQNDFKVEIMISDDSEEILIAGQSLEVIKEVKEYLHRKIADLADMRIVEVILDDKYHGSLIGQKGTNIRKFNEKHPNVLIKLGHNVITMKGPSVEVAAARADLIQEVETIKRDFATHNYTTEIPLTVELVKVATDAHGLKRYVTNLGKEHNVRLAMSPESNIITVQGLQKEAEAFRSLLSDKLKKLADRGSKSFDVAHELHAMLIGKGGKNIKHLGQKYNVKVTFPNVADETNNTINVTGPRANLQAAIDEMIEYVEYEQTRHHQDSMEIPGSAVVALLGRGGETIKELRTSTAVRIDVGDIANGVCLVSLEGTVGEVTEAKQRIKEIVEERLATTTETISCGSEKFAQLMGPGMASFRKLFTQYQSQGVEIIPNRTTKKFFLIRGKIENVANARRQLEDLLDTTFVTEQIQIPVRFHGNIIGSKGEKIKRLCESLDVLIFMPNNRDSAQPELVTIEGRPENVSTAKNQLLEIANNVSETTQEVWSVPRKVHGAIIGRGGAQIQKLRQDTGCYIIVPPSQLESDELRLRGTFEAISKAKEAIIELMNGIS